MNSISINLIKNLLNDIHLTLWDIYQVLQILF